MLFGVSYRLSLTATGIFSDFFGFGPMMGGILFFFDEHKTPLGISYSEDVARGEGVVGVTVTGRSWLRATAAVDTPGAKGDRGETIGELCFLAMPGFGTSYWSSG